MRRVHCKMRQIQKEWAVLVPLDEVDGVIGEEIRQIFTLRIVDAGRRSKIKMNAGGFNGFVEAALARVMSCVVAKVPLAEHSGGIAGFFQRVGDRDLVER